ncbi:hypothetical protein ACWD6R_39330, partial [Streptomyces sp. NPDC005151]
MSVDSPLATALGERYGSDAVAAELVPTIPVETLDRRNDTSPYYGAGRIKSYLTTSSATWCTAGFPWRYDGKWYMLTAGHCTTGNGAVMNPTETDYVGPVVRDNWNNKSGLGPPEGAELLFRRPFALPGIEARGGLREDLQ